MRRRTIEGLTGGDHRHGGEEGEKHSRNVAPECQKSIKKCNVRPNKPLALICKAWHYTFMEIESIRHKGLKRLFTRGDTRVMEAARLTDMLVFIANAPALADLETPPNFGFHALTGDRKGTYAMTVTRNWRLTFTASGDVIADLDLEDYHGS